MDNKNYSYYKLIDYIFLLYLFFIESAFSNHIYYNIDIDSEYYHGIQ